ncbi:MAG: hypothetical protein QXI35_06400, partial [Candidatus Nezhaarchaeales archaeon]
QPRSFHYSSQLLKDSYADRRCKSALDTSSIHPGQYLKFTNYDYEYLNLVLVDFLVKATSNIDDAVKCV